MGEWQRIADLFDFEKGSLQSSKCTPGEYTFITAAEEWKTHNEFTHDCEALIFAMGASGSLGRTHYFKGKFISSDLCFILQPKKHLKLDLTFYYYIFNFLRTEIVSKLAKGTSKLAINQKSFGDYKLPYFDYDHQLFFREKLKNIGGITSEIGNEFDEQLSRLKQLRQTVLQEAIEGKLTTEWRKQHPVVMGDPQYDATELLKLIKAEKNRLVKEGISKGYQPPIADENKPFNLPQGWDWCYLGDIVVSMNNGIYKPAQFYSEITGTPSMRMYNIQDGKLDLSKITRMILTDDEAIQYALSSGEILLNRVNSRELIGKAALVTGLKEVTVYEAMNIRIRFVEKEYFPRFVNLVLRTEPARNYFQKNAKQASGQVSINQTQVAAVSIPCPPLAEQQAIIARVDSLMAVIDELENQVAERKDQAQMLMQTVLREAFDGGMTQQE